MVNFVKYSQSQAGNKYNKKKCFNCNNFGHELQECKARYCSFCKKLWNAISDPGFHHCSNYSLRNNSNKSNLPINTQTQFIGNKRKINYDDNANMQKNTFSY